MAETAVHVDMATGLQRSYEAEARQHQEQLRLLGLDAEQLPEPAQQSATTLADSAAALGLREVSRTAFLAVVTALRLEQWELQDMEAEVTDHLELMDERCKHAERLLASLEAQVSTLDAAHADAGARCLSAQVDLEEAAAKRQGYEAQLDALQAQLAGAGFEPQLQHSQLLAQRQSHEAAAAALADVQARLARFHGLPPDIEEAQALLERRGREKAALAAQLESELRTL